MGSPNGNKETMDELRCKRKRDESESGEADGRVDAGKLGEGGSKGKAEGGRVDGGELKVSSDGSKGKDYGKAKIPSQTASNNDDDKLIACKTCSQTYHVKCVNLSSLEFIPEDWQCLNCTHDIDFLEPLANFKKSKKEQLESKNKCYICSSGKRRLIIIPQEKEMTSLLKKVVSGKNGIEDQEDGAAVSDPGISRAILKQNLDKKINNNDKLLILSEASSKSKEAEGLKGKSVMEKSNNNKPDAEKGATTQQSDQRKAAEAFQAKLKRLAHVRKMQREKAAASKKKNEVMTFASNSIAVVDTHKKKKSPDLQIVEKDDGTEGVVMMIDPKITGKGGETGNSASKDLISGQDKIPPNTSSHLKLKNVSASSSGSNPTRRPTSIVEGGADTTTTKEPRRPRLLATKPNQKPRSKSKQSQIPEPEPGQEPPVITWRDYELDALWVGVRKHGQGNWERMLEDPSLLLGISCEKTPQDLFNRWEIETQKLFPSAIALPLPRNNNTNVVPPNNNIITDQTQTQPQPQLQLQPQPQPQPHVQLQLQPQSQSQPQPHVQLQPQMQLQQNALERNNNNGGGNMMMLPGGYIVPHNPNMPAGITINWYPCIVQNQGLVWMPLVTSNAGGPSNVQGFSSSPSMVSQMALASALQTIQTPGGTSSIQGFSSYAPMVSQMAPTSAPQTALTPGGLFYNSGSSSSSLPKDSQKAPTNTPQREPTQGTPSISPKVSKKAHTSASRRAPKPDGCSSSKVSHKAPTSTPQRAPTVLGNTSYIQGSSSSSKKTPTSAPQRASSPMISDGPSFIQTPLPPSSSSKVSLKAPAVTPQKTPAPVLALLAQSSKVSQLIRPNAPERTPPSLRLSPLENTPPSATSGSISSLLAAQILHQRRNSSTTMIPNNPLSLQVAASTSSAENKNNDNEPKLLLGGCFTLPKFVVLNKKNDVIASTSNNNKKNEKAKDKEPMEYAHEDDTSSSE